jgi:hypothetical protein
MKSSTVLLTTSAWTAGMWVRQTAATTGQAWTLWSNPASGTCYTGLKSVGAAPWFMDVVGGDSLIAGGNIALNAWECFYLVHDGAGTMRVYRSQSGGAMTLRLTVGVTYAAGNEVLQMNDEATAARWRGQVAYVKEWQAALSLAEISYEAFRAKPGRTQNLLRFIPALNNASAGQDFSGLGNSLTKTGTLADASTAPPARWSGRENRLQD